MSCYRIKNIRCKNVVSTYMFVLFWTKTQQNIKNRKKKKSPLIATIELTCQAFKARLCAGHLVKYYNSEAAELHNTSIISACPSFHRVCITTQQTVPLFHLLNQNIIISSWGECWDTPSLQLSLFCTWLLLFSLQSQTGLSVKCSFFKMLKQ